jgi:hypothetical protein
LEEEKVGGGVIRKGNKGVSMMKVHCMQVWRCDKVILYFPQLLYPNKSLTKILEEV